MRFFRTVGSILVALAILGYVALAISPQPTQSSPNLCDRLSASSKNVELEAAISECSQSLNFSNLTREFRSDLHYHRASAYHRLGDFKKALADAKAARTFNPKSCAATTLLGWIYLDLGQPKDALAVLDHAIRRDPRPADYLQRCVVLYAMRKPFEALADCETAHAIHPSVQTTEIVADMYHRLSRPSSAQRTLETAIAHNMFSPSIYKLLANIYDAAGRQSDAHRIRHEGERMFPRQVTLHSASKP